MSTSKRMKRLRWKIARLMDKLPGQCWTDLVCWVLYRRRFEGGIREVLPWRPVQPSCLQPADERCYCGKLRAPDGPEVAR